MGAIMAPSCWCRCPHSIVCMLLLVIILPLLASSSKSINIVNDDNINVYNENNNLDFLQLTGKEEEANINTNNERSSHNGEENSAKDVEDDSSIPNKQSERDLQSSASKHYFCGRGYVDASKSCEHPCPSGSLEE